MFTLRTLLAVVALLTFASMAKADGATVVGGDTFTQAENSSLATVSPRDVFMSGLTTKLSGRVEKDAHVAGFSTTIDAPVGQDLYAVGFSVDVNQPVGDDLSAAGFDIHLSDTARVAGNARLTGSSVVVDAPIQGSLASAASEFTLNNSIAGDVDLVTASLSFGPNAKIGGTLTYRSTEPLVIPESVIPKERVRFEQITANDAAGKSWQSVERTMTGFWPTLATALFGLVVTLGFLALVAALLFGFAPAATEQFRQNVATAALKCFVLGALALSATLGLVPVGALSIIGIPLIPFAILACVILWIIGYVLGVYAIAARVISSYRPMPESVIGRVLFTIIAIALFALLNFIPVLGWLLNLTAMFVGLGAMTFQAARWIVREKSTVEPTTLPIPQPAPVKENVMTETPAKPDRRRPRVTRK
jgi:hypothetical protein